MKGIIFDFNGTMFQDSHLHEEAWVHMVNKYSKGSLSEEDILLNLHGRTNKEILNYFISDSLSEEEISKLSFALILYTIFIILLSTKFCRKKTLKMSIFNLIIQ